MVQQFNVGIHRGFLLSRWVLDAGDPRGTELYCWGGDGTTYQMWCHGPNSVDSDFSTSVNEGGIGFSNINDTKLAIDIKLDTLGLITLNGCDALDKNNTCQLNATCWNIDGVFQINPCPTITWSSNNPKIATVDSSGTVIPVSNGTVEITASSNGIQSSMTLYISGFDTSNNKSIYYIAGFVFLMRLISNKKQTK